MARSDLLSGFYMGRAHGTSRRFWGKGKNSYINEHINIFCSGGHSLTIISHILTVAKYQFK